MSSTTVQWRRCAESSKLERLHNRYWGGVALTFKGHQFWPDVDKGAAWIFFLPWSERDPYRPTSATWTSPLAGSERHWIVLTLYPTIVLQLRRQRRYFQTSLVGCSVGAPISKCAPIPDNPLAGTPSGICTIKYFIFKHLRINFWPRHTIRN